MDDKNYSGVYAIKIMLTDTAWLNEDYKKRIEDGELEKIFKDSKGIESFWKGSHGKFQNVPVLNNAKNAFTLMEKLNELPYIRELTLLKDGLRFQEGYIPVKDKRYD